MLAHEDTNVGIVVKYLELKFEDDPQLYKPIPKTPEWAPKGSEIELTLESWMSMKQSAIKKGGLKEDQPTGAIDGGFARLAKAQKDFDAKKKKGTLTDAELTLCKAALADLQAALQKFAPVKKNGEPLATMKDYAKDLLILVKQQGDQFEIDLLLIQAQQAEKAGPTATPTATPTAKPTATPDAGTAKPQAAKQPSAPSGVSFFKQGGDNLCAYYALNHFNNRDVGKDAFIDTAKKFYKKKTDVSDELAQKMVSDGNDPAVLTDFGLAEKGFGSSDAYVVAGVGKGHFWVIRKSADSWWTYDGLKAGPVLIGDDKAAQTHIAGKKLYA
jgi:hypothetical protein